MKPLQAYLIGFRIGDLRVRKFYKNSETIHVDCGSTRREQIELVEKLFDKYGRVWISKPNKKGVIQVECFLNNSFEFLLKIDQNSIPSWIMNNKLYFANFLAGFTDAEGSIFISQNKAFYALGNYNLKLLRQMKKSLMLLINSAKPISPLFLKTCPNISFSLDVKFSIFSIKISFFILVFMLVLATI